VYKQAKAGDMAGIEGLFISAQLAGANSDMIVAAADETGWSPQKCESVPRRARI